MVAYSTPALKQKKDLAEYLNSIYVVKARILNLTELGYHYKHEEEEIEFPPDSLTILNSEQWMGITANTNFLNRVQEGIFKVDIANYYICVRYAEGKTWHIVKEAHLTNIGGYTPICLCDPDNPAGIVTFQASAHSRMNEIYSKNPNLCRMCHNIARGIIPEADTEGMRIKPKRKRLFNQYKAK